MKITADTNVLLRAALNDDADQNALAEAALAEAEFIAIPVVVLCEFVWVLSQRYLRPAAEIASSIRALLASGSVHVDRALVDAGLSMLDKGGDFADGVVAFDGARMGGSVFVSFDRKAARLVREQGGDTLVLRPPGSRS